MPETMVEMVERIQGPICRCICGETHPCEHGYCRECLFDECPVCDKERNQ